MAERKPRIPPDAVANAGRGGLSGVPALRGRDFLVEAQCKIARNSRTDGVENAICDSSGVRTGPDHRWLKRIRSPLALCRRAIAAVFRKAGFKRLTVDTKLFCPTP
jgi:hypothetical protein